MSRQANYFYEHPPAYAHLQLRSGGFFAGLTLWATGLVGLAVLCMA